MINSVLRTAEEFVLTFATCAVVTVRRTLDSTEQLINLRSVMILLHRQQEIANEFIALTTTHKAFAVCFAQPMRLKAAWAYY